MGVDGISKADIFDEYFDDDKPKITNFEKIKAMNIDEMAEWFAKNVQCRSCFVPFCPDDKECDEIFKQWLESEVRG